MISAVVTTAYVHAVRSCACALKHICEWLSSHTHTHIRSDFVHTWITCNTNQNRNYTQHHCETTLHASIRSWVCRCRSRSQTICGERKAAGRKQKLNFKGFSSWYNVPTMPTPKRPGMGDWARAGAEQSGAVPNTEPNRIEPSCELCVCYFLPNGFSHLFTQRKF